MCTETTIPLRLPKDFESQQKAFDELTLVEQKVLLQAMLDEKQTFYQDDINCMPKIKLAFLHAGNIVVGPLFDFAASKETYNMYLEIVAERHSLIAERVNYTLSEIVRKDLQFKN